jgi:hypothetical protein
LAEKGMKITHKNLVLAISEIKINIQHIYFIITVIVFVVARVAQQEEEGHDKGGKSEAGELFFITSYRKILLYDRFSMCLINFKRRRLINEMILRDKLISSLLSKACF